MASTFDTLLGKLSSMLGDDAPEGAPQARNALSPKVGFRASMLPIGNYEDGSIAFPVWPQSAVDAGNALMRFHRGEAPQPEDAVLAGLAVAGGGLGHLGLRGSARAVSGRAPAQAGRFAPGMAQLEEVAPGQGFRSRGSVQDMMARARRSPYWPEWGEQFPERAMYSTLEQEAAASWNGAVRDVLRSNPNMERWQAEAEVMRTRPELGFAYQDARRTWKEHEKGRPLSPGEEWWDDLQALPGTPPDNSGLMDLMKQKFMVAGHPDLEARRLAREGQQQTPQLPKPDDETLFSNPKEGAPAGLLATSSLDRMAADDAVRPRPFPDAPMTYPELEEFVRTNRGGYSSSRADAAWREDPSRYDAYGKGLHDVLNPESQWFGEGPTLQSGGSVAPAAATGSSEHHSRSQPRGEGGRFVAKDSFDGRMAGLEKMLVDLDGDGTPDVAVDVPRPGNALLRTAARMPDQDVLRPPPPLQADVYEALRRERLNDPPMYRVQTPAGGRIAPPFISDRTILDQSDADRGLNLNVPAYFPKLLP